MQLRRSFALTAAALALTAPALTSCGFDYATDRYYTPANGANNRDGAVDVLGAVVVSTEPGSGTFIASFSNNSTTEPATFTELGATEGGDVTAAEFEPVEIAPGALVNLAEPPADIQVTGEFEAGDFVEVSLGFDNGENTVVEVPVVDNHGYFEGLDGEPLPVEESAETESSH
ncbi:hypothetical protein ASG88_04780 [Nocardioides sp. Soil777]|uniref:hypothetical protein n=1 Tax=Nocardioides sp. Soil777 TaxID=1736409 RepID=UPI0007038C13|nr:hypothetical protein [Nocardioides sp. Soil777]KRF02686.1 hypothetical protein ASG88_04780 [Nocardioides sp. Soil777]